MLSIQSPLRYADDRRSLAFVLCTLALLGLPYCLTLEGVIGLVYPVATGFLCFVASIINHNHMHNAMFRFSALNRILNVLLSIARGHTASGVIVPHNLNHHPKNGAADDWIRPALAGYGLGWARLIRYVIVASVNMAVQRTKPGAPRLAGDAARSIVSERMALMGTVLLACWYDWLTFLCFSVLPWVIGLVLLVGVNLLQHDGCGDEKNGGRLRDFTGKLGNWLCFNNGYHTAHHHAPALHWSRLPALHTQLSGHWPGEQRLEQSSILAYLWGFGWSRAGRPVA